MNRNINVKISSSQVHAEFLKIDFRKNILQNIGKLFFRRDKLLQYLLFVSSKELVHNNS